MSQIKSIDLCLTYKLDIKDFVHDVVLKLKLVSGSNGLKCSLNILITYGNDMIQILNCQYINGWIYFWSGLYGSKDKNKYVFQNLTIIFFI